MTSLATSAKAPESKLLLLCRHAEDLATRSAAAIEAGRDDELAELQSRKFAIVEELTALLLRFPPEEPEVIEAVAGVEAALSAELEALTAATARIRRELPELHAAGLRLSRFRQTYGHIEERDGGAGFQLSLHG